MTYPPQQPGPYGQQPGQPGDWGYGQQQGGQGQPQGQGGYGGEYGQQGGYGQPNTGGFTAQQPDPYQQQTAYQGMGGNFPTGPGGQPPKKSNTGMIVAIVAAVVVLLGGAGVGVYFLTKGDDSNTATPGTSSSAAPTSEDDGPTSTSKKKTTTKTSEPADTSGPAEVVEEYMAAYESKSFGAIVNKSCDAYKKKYGTDTSSLEGQLAQYKIEATAGDEPTVTGSVASGTFSLALTNDTGQTSNVTIEIKMVKESGTWKFCGEKTA